MTLTRLNTYTRAALEALPVAGPNGLRSLIRAEIDARNITGISGTQVVTLGKVDCVALLLGETVSAAPAPAQSHFALSGAISAPQERPTAPAASSGDDDPAALMRRAIEALGARSGVDETKVREIAHAETVAALNNGAFPVDRVKAIAEEVLAGVKPQRLEVTYNNRTNEVKGRQHKQFQQVLRAVTSRRAGSKSKPGKTINAFLYGSPGAGKSHVARQVADALGVDFTSHVCNPADTASKVTGFLNKANGDYAAGICYEWFKNGGVLFVDELCNADASFPVSLNSLVENDYFTFPNGETVERHPDTFLIVADNTNGTGSKDGFQRRTLDASTRSRFYFIKFEYDEQLEGELSGKGHLDERAAIRPDFDHQRSARVCGDVAEPSRSAPMAGHARDATPPPALAAPQVQRRAPLLLSG